MTVERPANQDSNPELERERSELFAQTIEELTQSLRALRPEESIDEARAGASVLLNQRWKAARIQYRGVVSAASLPKREDHTHFGIFDSISYLKKFDEAQIQNANSLQNLWGLLESYFRSGTFYNTPSEKGLEMSSETARGLVKLLCKDEERRYALTQSKT